MTSFSIITAAKNADRHIAACIDSVKRQTDAEVEHVIMDGGSDDDTVAIARQMLRPTDQLVSEVDDGIYDAMNRGLERARGAYILFLGADDFLADERVLADAAAFIMGQGNPDLVYGDLEVRHVDGARSVFQPPPPAGALGLMVCGCLPHQATFAHRDVFASKVGRFDTRYRVQADYDWLLRVLVAPGMKIRHMPRVVSSFAMGGASSRLQLGQEETYAIQNAFAVYREPEWMERRLHEFQRQVLALRLQLQQYEQGGASVKQAARRLLSPVARWIRR